MEKRKIDSSNGKERRSEPDRRSSERREPEGKSERGAITTRTGERRKKPRRTRDTGKK